MAVDGQDPWRATARDIRAAMRALDSASAIATVASVEGSAYRRPGAKMLVTTDGTHHGAVTAGCLEASVVDSCRDVIERGAVSVARFDLTTDDEQWGLGLGCDGVVDLLLEPRDASWDPVLSSLENRNEVTVVTTVDAGSDTAVGDRIVVSEAGRTTVPDRDPIPAHLLEQASEPIDAVSGTGATRTVAVGDGQLLVDGLQPVPRLLLFGSQNDLRPVIDLASRSGFRVTVHAQRGGVDESTFPRADTVRTGHPSTVADGVDDETYAVVMSHNFLDDRLALETLLEATEVPYIGVMGPSERFDRLRDALAADGVDLNADDRERLAAPVGLDLGGGGPVEVALSIVSEVLAVHNGTSGGRLRSQTGAIHAREL